MQYSGDVKYVFLLSLVAIRTMTGIEVSDVQKHRTEALRLLDESLSDKDSEHRQQALAALSTVEASDTAALERAMTALHDKDVLVRRAAALALGNMKATAALPNLKEALDDDSPEVSFAAA